eukprot:TRINITY_DN11598_c0_g1::TRINITY_DN11598_c0_g1_i1::g.21982::m.21982 TRINITY_DN11598_c0_g1::TRINITY_DN11598_c0_g1_i1::g.21982  ORF type:complete len:131 (+),score=4.24,Atrophin-1/PF03154.10/0.072 TRINITY_DN11598_c0_g1_i1:2-394(+)
MKMVEWVEVWMGLSLKIMRTWGDERDEGEGEREREKQKERERLRQRGGGIRDRIGECASWWMGEASHFGEHYPCGITRCATLAHMHGSWHHLMSVPVLVWCVDKYLMSHGQAHIHDRCSGIVMSMLTKRR